MTKVFGRTDCSSFNTETENLYMQVRGSWYNCEIDGRPLKMTVFITAVPNAGSESSTFYLSAAIYEFISTNDAGVKLAQTNTEQWTLVDKSYVGTKDLIFHSPQPILKAHTTYFLLVQGKTTRGAQLRLHRRDFTQLQAGIQNNLGLVPSFPWWVSPLTGENSYDHVYCINCTYSQDTTSGKQYVSFTP